MSPLQRNEFLPLSLTTVYTAPSGLIDPRTNLPYWAGGLYVGTYFDLTESEAQNLSGQTLHEGRYRFVQVDSGANSSNILLGTIGLMQSVLKGVNVVTSYDRGQASSLRPVVFLAPLTSTQITAGAYVFVQEEGWATVLGKTNGVTQSSPAAGDVINSIANGRADDPSANTTWVPTSIGYANGGGGGTSGAPALPNPNATATFGVLLDLPPIQG